MAYSTEGITRVRAAPLATDIVGGEAVAAPGDVEVTWNSSLAGWWHQVYVNGRLAGVTVLPEDRRLVVRGPVGRGGTAAVLFIEVIAVDAADRTTDLADELAGFDEGAKSAVRLSWQAGLYLDPGLECFDVFTDGRTGAIDYSRPLNDAPVPARPGGVEPWGYGSGGFGVGGYGQSAARYEYVTDLLEPGTWRFAVVAIDAAGNRGAVAAEASVTVTPVARPAADLKLVSYDPESGRAVLAWLPSPDV